MNEYDLSLVIACYKDAPHLKRNVVAIKRVLDATTIRTEWIFVEDAGHDGSEAILEELKATILPEARIIHHEVNRGRGATVQDGFAVAQGRVMGFLDIDLVVSPVHILEMYQAIDLGGADMAIARRIYRTSLHPSSVLRDALSYGYRFLARSYLLLDIEDTEAGYKFFERSAYARLAPVCRNAGWFWDTELIAQAMMRGMKLRPIPCLYQRSRDKVSTVRPLRDSWEYICQLVRFRHRHGIALAAARKRRREKRAAGGESSVEKR